MAFYSKLFGWKTRKGESSGIEYYEVDTDGGKGINGGIGASPTGEPMVTLYVQADDLRKHLDRALPRPDGKPVRAVLRRSMTVSRTRP